MNTATHVCDSTCIAERQRLAPLDAYFAQCLEGRTQLYTARNDAFECPRVQNEYDRLMQLCSIALLTSSAAPAGPRSTIARMTRPGSRNDLRNEE